MLRLEMCTCVLGVPLTPCSDAGGLAHVQTCIARTSSPTTVDIRAHTLPPGVGLDQQAFFDLLQRAGEEAGLLDLDDEALDEVRCASTRGWYGWVD